MPVDTATASDTATVTSDVTGETTAGTAGETTGVACPEPDDSVVVGAPCDGPNDCGPTQMCVDPPVGECDCLPGLVVCGQTCIDIKSDCNNCGRCLRACPPGAACTDGLCSGEALPAPGVHGPVVVSGGAHASECIIANEPKSERSISSSSALDATVAYMAPTVGTLDIQSRFNWGDADNAWTASFMTPPLSSDVLASGADPWSATHGGTSLEYFSYIASVLDEDPPPPPLPQLGRACVGVGAVLAETLTNVNEPWEFPIDCALVAPDSDTVTDGPVIEPDLGASALYVAYAEVTAEQRPFVAMRFAPCQSVPRDDALASCPKAWSEPIASDDINEHPSLVVSPCSHHPILLYRRAVTDEIVLEVRDTKAELLHLQVVDALPFAPNSDCDGVPCANPKGEICRCAGDDDCTQLPGSNCWDLAARVHGAARNDSATQRCSLYVAYDYSTGASGETYMKSRIRVLDITDEEFPAPFPLIASRNSSPEGAPFNDFGATVITDHFTSWAGLFFYRQEDGDPCTTSYRGLVSTSDFIASVANLQISEGVFPSVLFATTAGLGHYVAGPRFSAPRTLSPVWSEPVPTSDPCLQCSGQNYSLAVKGARVSP